MGNRASGPSLTAKDLLCPDVPPNTNYPVAPNPFVYSPAAALILLTALLGTKAPAGITRTQILNGVKNLAGRDVPEDSSYLLKLREGLPREGRCAILDAKEDATFCIGSMVFLDKKLKHKQQFLDEMSHYHDFYFQRFDGTICWLAKKFNRWVSDESKGKLKDLIVDPNHFMGMQLVLMNAIHFKAAWEIPFESREMTFSNGEKDFENLKAGINIDHFYYFEDVFENYRTVQLNFTGNNAKGYKFLLFLPSYKNTKLVLPFYTEADYIDLIKKKRWHRELIRIRVPEFKVDYTHDLTNLMKTVGVRDLFIGGRAQLPGITDESIKVSEMKQKVTMEFNLFGLSAEPRPIVPSTRLSIPATNFFCTEPFSFALVDSEREKLIFVGRYNQPY